MYPQKIPVHKQNMPGCINPARVMLSSCAHPITVAPHELPTNQIMSRVYNARGIINALPLKPSNTDMIDMACVLAGLLKLFICTPTTHPCFYPKYTTWNWTTARNAQLGIFCGTLKTNMNFRYFHRIFIEATLSSIFTCQYSTSRPPSPPITRKEANMDQRHHTCMTHACRKFMWH